MFWTNQLYFKVNQVYFYVYKHKVQGFDSRYIN